MRGVVRINNNIFCHGGISLDISNKFDINNTKIRQFPLRKDFTDLKIDENNIKEFVSNCITCQDKINLDNSFKIFKTHNAYWKHKESNYD